MSYLYFDKILMINFEEFLLREIFWMNKLGVYYCIMIVDCNICKYYGLLVIFVFNLDDENYVLLFFLDEMVI